MNAAQTDCIESLRIGSSVAVADLEQIVAALLHSTGMPTAASETAATLLTYAQQSGLQTHGIMHLPSYVRRLLDGTINPNAQLVFGTQDGAATVLEANDALGCLAADAATTQAMRRAESFGVGSVAVRNSSHFGPAGVYVHRAATAGFVAIAMSNASATMAPWGGRESLLGTNPIAAAFPRENAPPIVIDMATSAAARADIRKAANEAAEIPAHWAFDRDGYPTTNAQAALDGSMQPIGGAKGAALALMVELLCSCLAGGVPGWQVRVPQDTNAAPCRVSHFFVALAPDAFAGSASVRRSVDTIARAVEACAPREPTQPVRVPGSAGAHARERSLANGIELTTSLYSALCQASNLVSKANQKP